MPLIAPIHPELRFHNHASYLRARLGGPAARISVDGGFSCPNRDGTRGAGGCTFCNNDSFTSGILFPGRPVEEQVLRTIAAPGRHRAFRRLLVYFQRFTNSYGKVEELERKYRAAFCHPDVVGIVVGTRPDCLGLQVVDLLGEIARDHYVLVEVGLQSMSNEVLSAINRGHTVEEFETAVRRLRARGIDVGVHLIFGLPGDTRRNFLAAAPFLSRLDVQGVKLHHFHVVRGSGYEGPWRAGKVAVPEYEEYLDACVEFLARLSPSVAVLRLAGSAPDGLLLAPLWGKGNRDVARDVAAELARRGLHQGSLWGTRPQAAPAARPAR